MISRTRHTLPRSTVQGNRIIADNLAAYALALLDALNAHDLERVAGFYADSFVGVDVGQSQPQHGPRERVHVLASFVRAFPDLRVTGDALAYGNRVALFWTMTGTHRGTIMRIPPTGRSIYVRGTSLLTVERGKITHGLQIWDTAGFLRSLGLLPEL